jgi:hypothetical protein
LGFLEGAQQKYQQYKSIAAVEDPNQRYMLAQQLQRQVMQENRSRQNPQAASGR